MSRIRTITLALALTSALWVPLHAQVDQANKPVAMRLGNIVDSHFEAQGDQQQALRLRFQLITPNDEVTKPDPAIAEVTAALKDLFSFQRYRLLDQAVMAVDYFPGGSGGRGGSSTEQKLRGGGNNYRLSVTVDSVTPQGVRMAVTLMQEAARIDVVLRTKVTVSLDHTVVLGSTQPVASSNPDGVSKPGQAQGERSFPIILVVKPEIRRP